MHKKHKSVKGSPGEPGAVSRVHYDRGFSEYQHSILNFEKGQVKQNAGS